MGRKRFDKVDSKTGLVSEGFYVYVAPKWQNGFVEGWFAMAQSAGMLFAKSDLGLGEFRVLLMLFSKLDFQNLLVLNQAEIARELGMHRQHVQRAIKRLMEMNALLEGPKIGVSRSYRLNPNFGWKGSAESHVQALDEYRKDKMKAARITGVIEGGEPEEG